MGRSVVPDDLGLQVRGRDDTADWLEISLLVSGTRPVGRDEVIRLAADEPKVGETLASQAIAAIKARKELLGDAYPFEAMGGGLAVRAKPAAVGFAYASLLLLTSGSVARQTVLRESTSEMEVMLELLTESALARLWGPDSRSLRFGYPSEHGRPALFPDAIEWLASEMGIEVGGGYRPPRRKDGGVDVVAWRPFPDGRSGFPVVLAQATLQSEIFSKSADVDVRIWSSWLNLDFEPQTALAIPGLVPSLAEWGQLALRSMILDRFRLSHLTGAATDDRSAAWATGVVAQLSDLMLIGQT